MFKRWKRRLELNRILHWGNQKVTAGESHPLSKDVHQNHEYLLEVLGGSSDLKSRWFELHGRDAVAVYFDGLTDKEQVQDLVIRTLMGAAQLRPELFDQDLEMAARQVLPMAEASVGRTGEQLVNGLLNGSVVWLLDRSAQAMVIGVKGWKTRAVTESQTETVVRGPREGFTENLIDNLAMLRRKLRVPALIVEYLVLGQQSQTQVALTYLKGVCREELVLEARKRLQAIQIDAILESGYIEEIIRDHPYSPFPTIGNVEKPDTLAAKLLEGRVGIMVDGTPFALTAPKLFVENFQAPDDYYSSFWFATLQRIIRYSALMISTVALPLYIALLNYHQELIPTPLLLSIAKAREGTPFPAMMEVVIMLLVFEVVREASARMPRTLGQTVSIVGTLVIGQAAISAGLVGAPMIIVVAMTAVSSFLVIPLAETVAIVRLLLILASGMLGLYGFVMALIAVLVHICALESFKTPYLFPLAPLSVSGLQDTLVRAPWWLIRSRPRLLAPKNPHRQASASQQPSTSRQGGRSS